ncbi:uncharacterized protein LOC143480995 [Brachyhypopomus gauderio]|uniref:uncharacterized protein LOC143480995 n=1 Tax=Brachyhypopomus gauderio TaxID=698409 RepID=UPI0040415231
MVNACCVIKCHNRTHDRRGKRIKNGVRFFSFPAWKQLKGSQLAELTKRRRMAWVAAVRRANITFSNIPRHMFVCSRHFHTGKPAYEFLECHPDWAPSLHLGHTEVKVTHTERFSRMTKRRQAVPGDNTVPSSPPDLAGQMDANAPPSVAEQRPEEDEAAQRCSRYSVPVSRLSVWQRRKRPSDEPLGEEEPVEENHLFEHDYCAVPDPTALDLALQQTDELREEVERLRSQVEDLSVRQRFCLKIFASSDEDIRFYTRFATYNHLMSFWSLIEPSRDKFLHIARAASKKNKDIIPCPATQSLQPIDEFFLFMNYLSLGLKQRDLAHRFNISQSTVSQILVTWANYLYTVLGAVCIWMSQKAVKAHLPEEFKDYADTQVILDCTELRCQTPSSFLLQSEVSSSYKPHCTFKGLVGMAPHGAVTFVSALYAGSISDKQILKESGIVQLLTPEMAIMVDKGFLVDDCVPCKVHRPAFLSSRSQMPASEVRKTQSIARLRVHVERLVRRVKQHKLFDTVIPLSFTGTINQFYTVACLLVNYQNGPLVKEWAKGQ